MKITEFQIFHLSTRVDRNTALKAVALTEILNIEHRSGVLMAIYCIDPDDAAQNERIQITIDGAVVLNDATYDIPNTDDWIQLLASIAKGDVISGTAVNTQVGAQLDYKAGIPFTNQLIVEYLRAAAGAVGITINIVYAIWDNITT